MVETDEELEKIKEEKMQELMEKAKGPDYPDSPITITDSNFQEIVNKYPVVLVDFWSQQCPACRMMDKVIESLADKYSGKIVFGKLNIGQNPRTQSRFGIRGVPTSIIFKNGEAVERIVGMKPAPRMEGKLENYLD